MNYDFLDIEIAKDPNTPKEELERLAKSENPDVLKALASNTNLPASIHIHLYNLNDFGIKETLAQNPSTPLEILEKLAFENPTFEKIVVFNPSVPEELLIKILDANPSLAYEIAQKPNLSRNVIERILMLDALSAKIELAKNRTISEDVLRILYSDRDEFVRAVVASNPNAPYEILEDAVFCDNPVVRFGALKNPNLPDQLLFIALSCEDDPVVRKTI